MDIFIGKRKEFKLEIDVIVRLRLSFFLLLAVLRIRQLYLLLSLGDLFDQDRGVEFTFFHPALIRLLQQNSLELIVTFFEVRDQPVDNILKSGVFNDGLEWFAAQLGLTGWALGTSRNFGEVVINAAFAVSTHAFVDSVRIPVDALA